MLHMHGKQSPPIPSWSGTNNFGSNKAQLRELEQIRTEVLGSRQPLPPPVGSSRASKGAPGRPTLKTVAIAARFVARMQISARAWAKHEGTRKKLAESVGEMRKAKRARGLKVVRTDEAVGV